MFKYISERGLKNLDNYSYHGTDESFLGNNVLCHWWNWLVLQMPITLAPNLITFIGLLANIVAYIVVIYYSPTIDVVYPAWVSLFVAFSIFFYQSMDNIDGKQARRTGSSSPLGELFDHVCDATGVIMFSCNGMSSLLGGPLGCLVGHTCLSVQFYLAHWEEYNTGHLLMGKWDGPTEGQCLAMILHVFQAVLVATGNGGFWRYEIAGYPVVFYFMTVYSINTLLSVRQIFIRSFDAIQKQKKITKEESLKVLIPFTLFVILSIVWFFVSINQYTVTQMRMYFNVVGFIFGYLTSRLIVQRICKEPSVLFYPILIPLILVVINDSLYHFGLNVVSHQTGVSILFVYSIVNFLIFSYGIIQQLTQYLKINCFTIPPPKK
eukprot:TRINITY_DN3072_c0_g1_i1.p1 TRINITY_DN3072_c0_g1~~TRINITY_DN3072_c0_g1_i1.p1  ORF type:complete len:378 (-),score=67.64 TRINITY_DN3072_c0_g1_i1:106-1239(-)